MTVIKTTMRVGEIMTGKFTSVSPTIPLIEAARLMMISGTGVIAFCENSEFLGLITEKDIVDYLLIDYSLLENTSSYLLANSPPALSPEDDIMQAAKVMLDSGRRVLPVVQGGKLAGVFSLEDLARESLELALTFISKALDDER